MLNRLLTNGRVHAFARGLKEPIPHAVGHLEFLLKTAYDHVPMSGRLTKSVLDALESWACWEGKPGLFLRQLKQSHLIVKTKRGHYFGSFWQEAPAYIQNRWHRKHLRAGDAPCRVTQSALNDATTCALKLSQSRAA
jgi:hypothetical protein